MTTGTIRSGNATGIGTGTTKTLITPSSGLFLPKKVVALLDVKTSLASIKTTASETICARLDLESSDIQGMSPYEVLFGPVGSSLKEHGTRLNSQEVYKINAIVNGGSAMNAYATAIVANSTTAPEAQAFFIASTDPRSITGRQHKAKLGTATASGTTADTDVAGTQYHFSGGSNIIELFGYFHPLAPAVADMMIGEIKYKSTEFDNTIDQTLPLYPMMTGLGGSPTWLIPGISRQETNVPLNTNGQVNVQDYFNFGGALGAEGKFLDGVIYV